MHYQFETIGTIHSCFKEKFGIPRQPGLATEAEATLELLPPYNQPDTLQGLEGYSHLWISFVFHQNINTPWRPMVRPPRLGGNKKVGVFATRSPVRPNPLGLSVVELVGFDRSACRLHLKGVDLLDGTPVLDIKPYLPYVDAIADAKGGFAPHAPEQSEIEVIFEALAQQQLAEISGGKLPQMMRLIQQLLQLDPRPAYMNNKPQQREFGMHLHNFNLRWRMEGKRATIFEIKQVAV
ncbi:MAG: tRNA (N6-threonylcarbamoyladenosine(37)-N6)-methyltransferase TrmO [Candidatus Polarisedimenticolaceae bacterium]|nr:tRNA (N6-threonylcarbamoyladenosine(37)-N6)-methyltransferase TrmO [Candidatus Polarisedimenticolaceae bacterium]